MAFFVISSEKNNSTGISRRRGEPFGNNRTTHRGCLSCERLALSYPPLAFSHALAESGPVLHEPAATHHAQPRVEDGVEVLGA